ncbi:1,2-dihydroxy-3-keto-5-methylthiopentene dioxygenase [Ilumatobacter coccineus]|uniref:Acireductone dioxygenase n=1 Tax=Ilumatobacter coccineus (strain NBRC 103263 / KCTC 29153 / YM16-304) TaxID=1313172 RepID=A0A6C7EDB2_ILUCY|nr:1,2-dihydroxy-3-keto-5-methylthiopentene dioxygenase [Ilumatobacter coccineus]BAN03115.1 putative 1,2-dihydroxy-3-keto-5-methylthiopentene dioxygenase [Ilumatobacter coccineus YM16-304]
MSKLIVMPVDDPSATLLSTSDPAAIAADLGAVGVTFEQWTADATLAHDAGQDAVMSAYADDVARIRDMGFGTVDVVRLHGDPNDAEFMSNAAAARAKFLSEHAHADDEVRFFVEGSGAFYLRLTRPDGIEAVHVALCEQGDFISVPKDTLHWFDMGTAPSFAAIRFFQIEDGWVGEFTGDAIAERFPTFDELVAAAG